MSALACDPSITINILRPMTTAPESPPIPPSPAPSQPPVQMRLLLWMSFGYLLGLPVSELFAGVNLQTEMLKRQVGKRRLSYTITERLRLLEIQTTLGKHLRNCIDWIASPQTLAKAIKRHQECHARATNKTATKKLARPRLEIVKVAAIIKIHYAGCRGLSRIAGEMNKCGLSTCERSVRRVLNQQGLPPDSGREKYGSTWAQFFHLHVKQLAGVIGFPCLAERGRKITARIISFALPFDAPSSLKHDSKRMIDAVYKKHLSFPITSVVLPISAYFNSDTASLGILRTDYGNLAFLSRFRRLSASYETPPNGSETKIGEPRVLLFKDSPRNAAHFIGAIFFPP